MTEQEVVVVRLILARNCPTEARASFYCSMLNARCRTHTFVVERTPHEQWSVQVTPRPAPGGQP
jgi:hypothetical protein